MKSYRVLLIALMSSAGAFGCAGEVGQGESVGQTSDALAAVSLASLGMTVGGSNGVASRGAGRLDLFTIYNQTVIWYRYDGTSWNPYVTLTAPSGVKFVDVKATSNSGRTDVIAVGKSMVGIAPFAYPVYKLYHNHSTVGTGLVAFQPAWSVVPNAIPSGQGHNQLGLTSWGSGRLDAFWVTQLGYIGHAWGTNALTDGTENGDTPGVHPYLDPFYGSHNNSDSIDAVSWGPGRIDILHTGYDLASPILTHSWYDSAAGGWYDGTKAHVEGFSVIHDGTQNFAQPPSGFTILSAAPGEFDVYVVDPGANGAGHGLYTTHYSGGWSRVSPGGPTPILILNTLSTSSIINNQASSAIFWNDGLGSRRDIFGDGWQAYY